MAETLKLKEARSIVKHLEGLRSQNEDEDAKAISECLLPHRGFWPGDSDTKRGILERGKKNINPAGTLSLERAAGGLTTGLTPEGLPWFSFTIKDKKALESNGVREHLSYRVDLIQGALRTGGFYQAMHEFNMELLGFPGALVFADNSPKTMVRFECCTFGTYAIALDEEGTLDTVCRRIKWSAKQLEKKFGKEKLCKSTKELLKSSPYKKVDVIHVVRPRMDRSLGKIDNLSMPYESIMYEDIVNAEDDVQDILSESGYHEMPYFFAPYSRVGDSDYGMSLGHLLVGHVSQLNETERQKLIALQKFVSPPMKKPSNFKGRLSISPGAENSVSANDPNGLAPLYEVPTQGYQYALQEIQDIMLRIASVAKADLFYDMPSEMRPKDMTATEYMERKRERLQQIAPVVAIYEPFVLDKVIERVHNILDRAGMFPPPPPALVAAGQLDIEYISVVAKALRQVGAEATRSLLVDVGTIAKIQVDAGQKPTVLHKVDLAQAVDEIAIGIGAPARVIRDDETFEQILAEDAEREAQLMQQQQQMEAMEAATKAGGVKTEGTVAGKMMENQS